MKKVVSVLRAWRRRQRVLGRWVRFCLLTTLVLSNTLFGFPIDLLLQQLPLPMAQKIVGEVQANTNTYDFSDCSTTCDTDAGWYASGDDVDVFPFAGVTANRNTHTEVADADYSNLASSNDGRYSPTNPSTGDQNLVWMEMTVTEDPATIGKLEFTFEGSTATTASPFLMYIKTSAGAYETDASWTVLSGSTTIAAGTETTITRFITDDQVEIDDYFDGSNKIVWAVYQSTSALTLSVDYVKMDVTYTPVQQEGYRFRADDGNETAATWVAAQDTAITRASATNTRLRTLVNSTGAADPDTSQYQLEYKRSSDSTYYPIAGAATDVTPTVQTRSSGASTAVNATSHVITMPSGITAGDLLIIVFSTDGTADVSITAGDWIKLDQETGTGVSSAVFYKFAAGSDTATVTTGSEQTSHIVFRISGASVPYIAQANGDSTNTNPPDLDTGTSRNYLWIATATHDSTVVASAAPTNYATLTTQAAAGTAGASTSTAERSLTASSENPGTFTSSTEQWTSFTIAVPSSSMGIKAGGATPAQSTTSMSIAYPVGIEKGDLLVMGIANKHTPNGPSTPSGWTAPSNNQASGTSGADGLDTGSVYATVFYRIADGTEKGSFTVSIPSANATVGRILAYKREVGKEWSLAAANGSDTTVNTTWSVTAGSNPGIIAGDMVLAVSAINSDPYSYNAQTMTATGVTFDTAEKEISETGTTSGNDAEVVFSNHFAISGTASAAPVYTMTVSSSATNAPVGATIFFRVRQVTAPITLSASTNITASGDNTTAQLTAPAGKTTGDFLTGRMQDDENPADTINLSSSQYTELEWNLIATSTAVDTEIYYFRITVGGVPIGTYTVTPQWTIGAADPDVQQIHYRWRNDDGDQGSPLAAGWYDQDWGYRKKMTIDAAQVSGSSDLTNFTILISYTNADLKDTGNSGHVGQSDGGDILFTNSSGTKLDHELTRYTPATGEVIAWVEIPTLDYNDNIEIYIYYGNASVANQWNITGTWSNSYAMVHHFNETSGAHLDATSNNNDTVAGTVTTQGTATSKIDGADDFNGSSNYLGISDSGSLDLSNFTISAWVSVDTFPGASQYDNILDKQAYYLEINGTDEFDCGVFDGSFSEHTSTTANLATGTYYYLSCAFDNTNDLARVYKNNSEVVNEADTKTPNVNTTDVGVMALSGGVGQHIDGRLDELIVSSEARTADWIFTQYNNQNSPGVGGFLSSIDTEESSSGTGATWEANEDTAITSVPKSTTYRVRFALSNEGGTTTGAQTYQLEVAETGTCSSGTYAAVPTDTSGDWQVTASTHFTDGAATTNFSGSLTDENTTFVAGEIKDTGNTTGNITLGTTNFTEIEFAVSATSNATDSGSYCFRLTNVDTYTVYPQATIAAPSLTFTQSAYRWYEDSDNENVTELWGTPNLAENGPLALLPATNAAPIDTTELRLRIALTIGGVTLSSTSQQFKLQYKAGTDASCTSGSWTDVGAGGGGVIWRYATSGVTDGTTLTALKITAADVLQVYAKSSPTTTNPNSATVGQDIEYDFHIQNNVAADATTYSFRVVESDGTVLTSYTNCPTLTTRQVTSQQMRHGTVFTDEVEAGATFAD